MAKNKGKRPQNREKEPFSGISWAIISKFTHYLGSVVGSIEVYVGPLGDL